MANERTMTPSQVEEQRQNSIEEDDELVAEIPIYLSSKLSKYLCLFQYPLRNAPFSEHNGPMAARIKPNANMVELDLPLDTRSTSYSTERGEDFALGTNEKAVKTAYDRRMEEHEDEMMGRFGHQEKKEELLDKMTLTSTMVPNQTTYLAGVLHKGKNAVTLYPALIDVLDELHITPVKAILQLRPGLTYIDKIDEKYKVANKRIMDVELQEERKATFEQPQAIQVSVRSADQGGAVRQNLYSMAVRNADQEAWQNVSYFNQSTQQAEKVYDSLFCTSKEELVSPMSQSDYLSLLCGNKKYPFSV